MYFTLTANSFFNHHICWEYNRPNLWDPRYWCRRMEPQVWDNCMWRTGGLRGQCPLSPGLSRGGDCQCTRDTWQQSRTQARPHTWPRIPWGQWCLGCLCSTGHSASWPRGSTGGSCDLLGWTSQPLHRCYLHTRIRSLPWPLAGHNQYTLMMHSF